MSVLTQSSRGSLFIKDNLVGGVLFQKSNLNPESSSTRSPYTWERKQKREWV